MEQTNESMPAVSTRSIGVKYGLILAVISVAYFMILTIADVDMTTGVGRWGSLLFYIVALVLAHKNYKDNGDGFMSYGQGLGIGFWMSLVSSVVYSIFFYVYIKFIDSSFIESIKNKQMEDMQARGMSDAEIEQAMKFAGAFTTPESMLIFGVIGGIIMVMICALIVTIFTQKRNPNAAI